MRSFWLGSAALLMSTGLALAQTATPAPAPTAGPSALVVTQPGASPGNTASADAGGAGAVSHPNSAGTAAPPTMAMSPNAQGAMSGGAGASTPAPDGAPSEANMTSPGASPGKTAPAAGTQASNAVASPDTGTHVMHHEWGALPNDASAHSYLHMAKMAIHQHDTARADEALSRAETRLLTRAVPASDGSAVDQSPAITAITNARSALRSGDFAQASTDTDTALQAE
jgi:hypothetical protein